MPEKKPLKGMKIEDVLAHQLRRAMQAWAEMWRQQFDDLTTPQYGVLRVLQERGPLDQTSLGGLTAIDRSTLTTLLDRLEGRGLVTRTIDPANRRIRIITLTGEGRAYLDEALVKVTRVHEHLGSYFGDDELGHLAALLQRLGDMPPPRDG